MISVSRLINSKMIVDIEEAEGKTGEVGWESRRKNTGHRCHESTRAYRLLPAALRPARYHDRKFFNFQASKLQSDHVIIEDCVPGRKRGTRKHVTLILGAVLLRERVQNAVCN